MKKKWIMLPLFFTMLTCCVGSAWFSVDGANPVDVHGPLTTNDVREIRRLFRNEMRLEILPNLSWTSIKGLPMAIKRYSRTKLTGIYFETNGSGCVQTEPAADPHNLSGSCFLLEKGTNGWHIEWGSQGQFWACFTRFKILRDEADLVLEARASDSFRQLKPSLEPLAGAGGEDGYLKLIPTRKKTESGLAILIVPGVELLQGTHKIMDEVILDVRDVAKVRGFDKFLVGCYSHGFALQIYASGLPTREEVAKKRKDWKETSERLEREAQKAPSSTQ